MQATPLHLHRSTFPAPFDLKGHRWIISAFVIGASSAAGALVFPLSSLGRTAPASASKEWLLLLVVSWAALCCWAFGYSALLTRLGLPAERSLLIGALGHTPLLLCLALPVALYSDDLSNHIYANSPYGQLIAQPMAKLYVVLSPLLVQALALGTYLRANIARFVPISLVVLVSLVLRLWNLNWGFPALYHPDEAQYLGRAVDMFGRGDLNPRHFTNPSLLIYVDYVLWVLLSPHVQTFHLLTDWLRIPMQDPRGDLLVVLAGRAVSAASGTGTVVATYLLGRELFDRRTAILASALLSVSLLHVRDSHYATNDVFATALLTFGLFFAARVYRRGRTSDYLLAGLLGGLATSAKYNMGVFSVACLVAHALRPASDDSRNAKRMPFPLIGCFLAAGAGFVAGTPYSVLDFGAFSEGFRTQLGYGSLPWYGQDDLPSAAAFLASLLQGFGLIPLLLTVVGVLLKFKSDRRGLAVLLSAVVIYMAFMFTQQLFFARFAMPVLGPMSVLVGRSIQRLAARVTYRPTSLGGVQFAFAVLAVAQPAIMSVQHDLLLGQPDTRAEAARWMDANVPPDRSVVVDSFAQMGGRYQWSAHLRDTSAFWPNQDGDWTEILRGDFDWVIVSSYGYEPLVRQSPSSALRYLSLQQNARLAAVFAPGPGNADVPYSVEDGYTPFWHLFDRERSGPTIEVYQIARERRDSSAAPTGPDPRAKRSLPNHKSGVSEVNVGEVG